METVHSDLKALHHLMTKKIVRIFCAGMILLLSVSISSAQVRLLHKTVLEPERFMVPDTLYYGQNTRTGEILIVWYEHDQGGPNNVITGRIVDGKGQSVGNPFVIAPKANEPVEFYNGADGFKVAYNPVKNEYLVTYSLVYDDSTTTFSRILAQRLGPDGSRKGKPIDLTSKFPERKLHDNKPRKLKFDPVNKGFLQLSHRHDFPSNTTTYGFFDLLTSKAKPARPSVMLNWFLDDDLAFPDFIFLPSGKLLLTTVFGRPTFGISDLDYLITTVDPFNQKNLTTLKPEDWTPVGHLTRLLPLGLRVPVLELIPPDSPIIYFTDDKNVKGQKFNSEGKPEGRPFLALNSPANKTRLQVTTVAFLPTPSGVVGLLIALDVPGAGNSVTIWAQALDSNGKPTGVPKKLFRTLGNERIHFDELFALPVQAGDRDAHFVWYGLKVEDFDHLGVLKLDISFPLP